jgi:hypothetical protein
MGGRSCGQVFLHLCLNIASQSPILNRQKLKNKILANSKRRYLSSVRAEHLFDDPWQREAWQRNAILRGMPHADPSDSHFGCPT